MSVLDLKVKLLAEKAERTGEVQKRLDAETKESDSIRRYLEAKKSVPKEQSHDKITLKSDLKAARVWIGREERVFQDFAEHVCTGYTTLIRAQAFSDCDGLSTMLDDAQERGKYIGGFRVCVGRMGIRCILGTTTAMKNLGVGHLPRRGIAVMIILSLGLFRLVPLRFVCCLSFSSLPSPIFFDTLNGTISNKNGWASRVLCAFDCWPFGSYVLNF